MSEIGSHGLILADTIHRTNKLKTFFAILPSMETKNSKTENNILSSVDMLTTGWQDYFQISRFKMSVSSSDIFLFQILSSCLDVIASVSVFIEIGKLPCSLKSANCLDLAMLRQLLLLLFQKLWEGIAPALASPQNSLLFFVSIEGLRQK